MPDRKDSQINVWGEITDRDEIQRMIDRSIAHHERKFSVFGIVTAIVALVLGIGVAIACL